MKASNGELICDHCGEKIPQIEYRHTWVGPVVAKVEAPRHYHLAREHPACRRAGGIDVDPPGGSKFSRFTSSLIRGLKAPG